MACTGCELVLYCRADSSGQERWNSIADLPPLLLNERRRDKYHTDEQYRLNKIEKAKQYHNKKLEELGVEKKPQGRPRKY